MPALFKNIQKSARIRSRKILLALLFVFVFLISATATYLYLSLRQAVVKKEAGKVSQEISQVTTLSSDLLSSYNVLLLGYGGAGHEGGTLADTIILANINSERKKVTLISVPRDLWVEIPIRSDLKQNFKINHAYAIGLDDTKYPLKEPQYKGENGAATLAKKVVGEVTGMQIKYLIALDFEGFKNIVDILGGIEVNVPVAFDDYFYPIKGGENYTCGKSAAEIAKLHELYSDTKLHQQFECRYENIHFDTGPQTMDGEPALKFVRSRNSPQHGGDFARSERQHAVLLGVKDKLITMNAVRKADELFEQFVKMIRTDLDLKTVKDLVEVLGNPDKYRVSFVSLNDENVLVATKSFDGQFILIPKEGEGVWNGVQKYIYEQIGKN